MNDKSEGIITIIGLIGLTLLCIAVYNSPRELQRRDWNNKFYGCAQDHTYRTDCDIILRNATYVKPKICTQYGCH